MTSVLVFQSDTADPVEWRRALTREMPGLDFRVWPDTGDPAMVDFLFVLRPPPDIARYTRLKFVQLISAGTDQISGMEGLPGHIPVARMVEPGQVRGMCEYALHWVLHYHRDFHRYRGHQSAGLWKEFPRVAAAGRPVGVVGLGALGMPVAETLRDFGFEVHGWSRRHREIAGVAVHAGREALTGFLRCCDIVIGLLPLAPDTVGFYDEAFFAGLRPGSAFINAGRGPQCDVAALIAALESGRLSGATLDVLPTEPPDEGDPVWNAPNISITPHVATSPEIDSAASFVAGNLRRVLAGEPPDRLIARPGGA